VKYCALEFLLAEVVDFDFELDVGAVEEELFLRDGQRDACVVDRHVERHDGFIISMAEYRAYRRRTVPAPPKAIII
jgi:hypothetical protein